jgi:hypothetical protein
VKKILLSLMILLLMFGCSSKKDNPNDDKQENTDKTVDDSALGFGSTIEIDGMEITFGAEAEWFYQDNSISSLYEQYMIKISVHLVNISDDVNYYNALYNSWYDTTGNQIQMYMSLQDDDINSMGSMLSGAESDYYLYIPYLGDGKYTLIVNDFETKVTLEFDIIIPEEHK